jgi:hypothetical protein
MVNKYELVVSITYKDILINQVRAEEANRLAR